jgi:hypothetical protein
MDVPDRLPYEVLHRVSGGAPEVSPDHHLGPLHIVMATKGSGTVRPFARINPIDVLLYQALIDALAPELERHLGSRDEVFAFRQDTTGADDPYFETPVWTDFMGSIRDYLSSHRRQYAMTTDVTNFFVHIEVDELERRLLEVSEHSAVVRDLGDLLRTWQQLGVRGLPQGVPPSSPLGNIYLAGLDDMLRRESVEFRRYMDDLWIFAPSYSDARQLQDRVERLLYADKLGLGGEKSTIRRSTTALRDTENVEEIIEARREALRTEAMAVAGDPYVTETEIEYDEEEIDEVAAHAEYDELISELSGGGYPDRVRPRLTAVYAELARARDPYALEEIPTILLRMPDLTPNAVRYAARVRADAADEARQTLLSVMSRRAFHRDQEWLHLCRAALLFPHRPSPELAERYSEVATSHEHPLVRARALLAWGSQSHKSDFDLADEFWPGAAQAWRSYVLVAIQRKDKRKRDARYRRWSGEERFLRQVANELMQKPLPWAAL